ncbi:biopolymer transporter ExbD [bacterium]|nr:biopolymer transporter ExbD [bacterium]
MPEERSLFYKNKALNDINMTPLIDVTMVMLIIFILIAPVMEQGITVKLPSTSTKKMSNNEAVTISIANNKKIYLCNSVVSLPELEKRLKTLQEGTPDLSIVLRADKNLPYQIVVKVMDIIQKSGIVKLGIATKTERVKK